MSPPLSPLVPREPLARWLADRLVFSRYRGPSIVTPAPPHKWYDWQVAELCGISVRMVRALANPRDGYNGRRISAYKVDLVGTRLGEPRLLAQLYPEYDYDG